MKISLKKPHREHIVSNYLNRRVDADKMIERFQQVIEVVANGNRSQFSKETGKASSFATNVCQGRVLPTIPYLIQLAERYQLSLNWLLLGRGQMKLSKEHPTLQEGLSEISRYEVQASAGSGFVAEDHSPIENLAFHKKWSRPNLNHGPDHLVLITVEGDSMSPTLEDNDLLLVDSNQQVCTREGIYLIRMDGNSMVKRLQPTPRGEIQIISDNSQYPTLTMEKDELSSLSILGRSIWFGRVF